MSVTINGTSGLTFNDASIQNTAATGFGFKNRLINSAMMIDQRNAGASVTITNTVAITYTIDRWWGYGPVASKFSIQRNAGSVTPPVGFTNYLGCTSLSAYSVGAAEEFSIGQGIEGFNIADLAWGTANAQPVTVSFWVRSSLTGTFGGNLRNSSATRSYPFSYTITSANTWEQKSVTIAGDTSGTWLTTNGVGMYVGFSLGVGASASGTAGSWQAGNLISATGATSVVGTSGATFYITGVQLEKGSTATSFDYRPYGTELALCQRYYARIGAEGVLNSGFGGTGAFASSSSANISFQHPVKMRAAPTLSQFSTWMQNGATAGAVSSISATYANTGATFATIACSAVFTATQPAVIYAGSNSTSYIDFSAEL